MFRRIRQVLYLVAALAPCSAQANFFSDLIVFGDSLSDTGNFSAVTSGAVPGPNYFAGRFSNGPNYADIVAQGLEIPLAPSLIGGTNYAVGAARTDFHPNLDPLLPLPSMFSVQAQVANYLASAGGVADPLAAYILWGGANDMQEALAAVAASVLGGASPTDAFNAGAAVAINSAMNVAVMAQDLVAAGVDTLIVPNIPNIGLTPRVSALETLIPGSVAAARGLTEVLNTTVDSLIASLAGANVVRLDVFSLFEEAAMSPSAFGFDNTTDPCAFGASPGGSPVTPCLTPDTFVFWDDFHPTAAAHAAIGEALLTAIPAPGTLYLVFTGLVLAGRIRRIGQ